jgi:hypothetical protein
MQLNLFWILFFVFLGIGVIGVVGLTGMLGMSPNNKILGYGSGTVAVIGVIGVWVVVGLMLGGVLETFENKEKQSY